MPWFSRLWKTAETLAKSSGRLSFSMIDAKVTTSVNGHIQFLRPVDPLLGKIGVHFFIAQFLLDQRRP